jgi:hypothetical protein
LKHNNKKRRGQNICLFCFSSFFFGANKTNKRKAFVFEGCHVSENQKKHYFYKKKSDYM